MVSYDAAGAFDEEQEQPEIPSLKALLKDSVTSTYVDDAYYAKMRQDLVDFDAVGRILTLDERDTYEGLVLHEGWLLDRRRLEDWLDLYSQKSMYWIPATADVYASEVVDPRKNVTIACDDRRRIIDRIVWLRTGLAYSQLPPSYTTHLQSGFVAVPSHDPAEFKLRSQFVIHEQRDGHERQALAGWMGHTFVEEAGAIKIARKIVSLVDGNRDHHNLVFLL